MKKLFNEFKEFIAKGNVMVMAVGIIIGGAFTAIVNSLVADIFSPLLNTILGGISFNSMKVRVKFPWITTLIEKGKLEDYPTFKFGSFIQAIITFLVTAIALFAFIKAINALKNLGKKEQDQVETAPTTRICPHCFSEVNIKASKCPFCTSDLVPEVVDEEVSADAK